MAKHKAAPAKAKANTQPKKKKMNMQKVVVYLIIGVFLLSTVLMGIGTLL